MMDDLPNSLKRCDVLIPTDAMEPSREVVIVPKWHREFLSKKEMVDYYEYRKPFLKYLVNMGKNLEKAKGYSPHTVYNRWIG